MKLVETDIRHDDDPTAETSTPPRPEHRRVYVSLIVTLSVLVATVAAVYTLFPKRDNELLTVAVNEHTEPADFDLPDPTQKELTAWSAGVIGRGAPWPRPSPEIEIVGARAVEILGRPAALARYRAAGHDVTMVVMRARVAPARKFRRREAGLYAISWRRGKWTLAAVGPEDSAGEWRPVLGVP